MNRARRINWFICVPPHRFCAAKQLAEWAGAISDRKPCVVVYDETRDGRAPRSALLQGDPRRRFAAVAALLREEPFGWLEPGSIPLDPSWAETLDEVYERARASGRDIVLPHASGRPRFQSFVGIYPPGLELDAPELVSPVSWSQLFFNRYESRIFRTPLIQQATATEPGLPNGCDGRFYGEPTISIPPGTAIYDGDEHQTLIHMLGPTLGVFVRACG